jgi:predicted O-methyltransferase YrrM
MIPNAFALNGALEMDITDLSRIVCKGFIADEEAKCLYGLARDAALHGPCLEIGSYCGRSAAYLGMGCRDAGGILFSVDHHQGSEEQQPGQGYYDPDLLDPATGRINTFPLFCKTIRELSLEDTVIPIVARSEVVARFWRTPLSLLFIDGGHSFETVFADYNAWVSHLLPGGYLIIHDIFTDPTQGGQAPYCIYNMALASGLFFEFPMIHSLGVLKRSPAGSLTDESKRRWSRLQT